MKHHIGVDIVEIKRIEKAVARWGKKFIHRVYTGPERRLYRRKLSSLAVRFAGKEAVAKALGARNNGIRWKDIEILSADGGKPVVRLYGRAQNQATSLGLGKFAISLSHSREYAVAFVTSERG